MLRGFFLADEDHRNIPTVLRFQERIGIYIYFSKRCLEFLQERRDGGLGFVAEVAAWARVESNVAGAASGKAVVFGMCAHRFVAKLHLTGEQAPMGRTGHNNKAIV